MNDKKLIIAPGFTKDSPQKIIDMHRAQKRRQEEMIRHSMPIGLILSFNGCVAQVLQTGKPAQIEIALGPDKEHAKSLRVVLAPMNFGEVVDTADGKKLRLLAIEDLAKKENTDGLQHDHDARTGGEESHSGSTPVQPE